MPELEDLDTEKVRESLSALAEELKNEIDLNFQALEEPLVDVNQTLESKFLKRFLVEFGKLRTRLCEQFSEKLEDCVSTLEAHDEAIEAAFEELTEEEEEEEG